MIWEVRGGEGRRGEGRGGETSAESMSPA